MCSSSAEGGLALGARLPLRLIVVSTASGRTVPRAFITASSLLRSGPQQRLDGAAPVHGAVPLGHLFERQRQVEDLAGLDGSLLDQRDELGEIAANRGRTAVQVQVGEEQLLA